jgi:hypothetical protein
MAQTHKHETETDSNGSITISVEDWITAGRSAGFVMREDGAMRLFKNGMLAWLPMPNGNGGLVTVCRAMAEFGANRGGQSLNGISFQTSVNNVASGDGPAAKTGNNNAEERAFKAFLEPLAISKLGLPEMDRSKEDQAKLTSYLAAAVDHAPLREKYFAKAISDAEDAGLEDAAANEKRKRTKKASTADFSL